MKTKWMFVIAAAVLSLTLVCCEKDSKKGDFPQAALVGTLTQGVESTASIVLNGIQSNAQVNIQIGVTDDFGLTFESQQNVSDGSLVILLKGIPSQSGSFRVQLKLSASDMKTSEQTIDVVVAASN